jgi:hypothetical protein
VVLGTVPIPIPAHSYPYPALSHQVPDKRQHPSKPPSCLYRDCLCLAACGSAWQGTLRIRYLQKAYIESPGRDRRCLGCAVTTSLSHASPVASRSSLFPILYSRSSLVHFFLLFRLERFLALEPHRLFNTSTFIYTNSCVWLVTAVQARTESSPRLYSIHTTHPFGYLPRLYLPLPLS